MAKMRYNKSYKKLSGKGGKITRTQGPGCNKATNHTVNFNMPKATKKGGY